MRTSAIEKIQRNASQVYREIMPKVMNLSGVVDFPRRRREKAPESLHGMGVEVQRDFPFAPDGRLLWHPNSRDQEGLGVAN